MAKSGSWFSDETRRSGPHAPSDFNLFEIPRYGRDDFAKAVCTSPKDVCCLRVAIRDIGDAILTLGEAIREAGKISTADISRLLDEYLAAACPKCLTGHTGHSIQLLAALPKARTMLVDQDPSVGRWLGGSCPSCDSQECCVVWHGDASRPIATKERHEVERVKVGGWWAWASQYPLWQWAIVVALVGVVTILATHRAGLPTSTIIVVSAGATFVMACLAIVQRATLLRDVVVVTAFNENGRRVARYRIGLDRYHDAGCAILEPDGMAKRERLGVRSARIEMHGQDGCFNTFERRFLASGEEIDSDSDLGEESGLEDDE